MGKSSKVVVLFLFIFCIYQCNLLAAERGMNPNQPFSPGDWLDKSFSFIMEINGGTEYFTIIYKGIEGNSAVIELVDEIKGNAHGADGTKTKVFKLVLDGKKTFLNVLSEKQTFLLTVIDDKKHITLQKTESFKRVPIRFYPDVFQAAFYHSADFDKNRPLSK